MGNPCHIAHPNGLKSMAEGPKAKLVEAVNKSPKLDFVSGWGPATPSGEASP
jgi:hypothetical protein